MKDGIKVRDIAELKANFDIEKVVEYFCDGTLQTWCEERYYEEEVELLEELAADNEQLRKKLFEIFEVIAPEEIEKRNARIAKLKQFTDDDEIIKNIDNVAFDQEELAELYDKGVEKIYLCEGEFRIPKSKQTLEYIKVGDVKITCRKKSAQCEEDLLARATNVAVRKAIDSIRELFKSIGEEDEEDEEDDIDREVKEMMKRAEAKAEAEVDDYMKHLAEIDPDGARDINDD